MKKLLLVCGVFLAGCNSVADSGDSAYDKFAQCLNQSGAHLYVSQTCPHCHQQLGLFGESVAKLNYIDCSKDSQKCADAEVRAVPTWIFASGERVSGSQPLETLSAKTGCQFQK